MKCNECTDDDKQARGCNGGVDWEIGPYTVNCCPEQIVKECIVLINMWQDWKTFGFPFIGHWSEQPKYIIDLIRTLENEMAAIQQEKRNN